MADKDKKKVILTVKKTTSPFQFPVSSVSPVTPASTIVTASAPAPTPVPALATGTPVAPLVPTFANAGFASPTVNTIDVPEKRKRGRPRLNKEVKAKVEDNKKEIKSVEVETPELQETEETIKKRGRKPKNQSLNMPISDKVYGIFMNKTTELEKFENMSYIINLKISKERVEELLAACLPPSAEPTVTATTEEAEAAAAEAAAAAAAATDDVTTVATSVADLAPAAVAIATEIKTICDRCKKADQGKLTQYEHYEVDTNPGYVDCYVGELMPGFASGDSWPLTSKFPCRNCDEPFPNIPAGLVKKIVGDCEVDPINCKFYMYLNFCSPSCAARFAFDRLDDWVWHHTRLNFCYNTVWKKANPLHKWTKIKMAPDLAVLSKNGGRMSIEDYRKAHNNVKMYDIYVAPMIPLKMTLEESLPDAYLSNKGSKQAVMVDKSRIQKAEQSIKNRKNSEKSSNSIDKLMKMQITT
jgi:23S rRNA maturation mini-RNase III